MNDDPLTMPELLIAMVVSLVVLGTFLFLLVALGVIKPYHASPHEHCVQQNYVHHAKTGYHWDCVKWAKL